MRSLTGVAAVLAFVTACGGGDEQQPGDETAGSNTGGVAAAGASHGGSAGKSSSGAASGGASQGGASQGGSDDGGATQGGKSSGGKGGVDTGGKGGSGGSGGGGTGSGGQATTPEALMPIVTAYCATARACCKNEADVDLDDCETEFAMKNETVGSLERQVLPQARRFEQHGISGVSPPELVPIERQARLLSAGELVSESDGPDVSGEAHAA